VAEAEGAVTDVSQIDSGQVHIGATPGISVYLIPEWMQSFRARYPNLSVSLQTVVTPQIEALLRTQAVDVGFIEGELDEHSQQGIHVVPLEAVEQYVIVGPHHAWWGRGRVDIHALDQRAFIMRQVTSQTRRWLDAELHHYQVRPKITAEFDNLESIKRAVASGTCLTILPEYTVRQEESLGLLQRIPIAAAPLQRTLKAIWWKGNLLNPVTRAFLTHLTRYFPNVGLP
jgi:DNA-binding transcriptional LysR family regulator